MLTENLPLVGPP